MLTFHYTIRSSFPLHISSFPKLFVFRRGKKSQHKATLFGWGLGEWGGKWPFFDPVYWRVYYIWNKTSIRTDDNTCNVGILFWAWLTKQPTKDSWPLLSVPLSNCCGQLGSVPWVVQALLTAKKLQVRKRGDLKPVKFISSFVFEGMLNYLPFWKS